MDTCVVHDNHRVRAREFVHVVKKSVDKTVELFCSIRVIFDGKVEDPIEGECRKNRVTVDLVRLIYNCCD
jgi:hypothetical protein